MKVTFTPERETKRTWRFAEDCPTDDEPKIGTIYVRKSTLKELGWQTGDSLVISLGVPQ